jgi:acyl-CoA thioester hydrolase
MTNPFIWPIRVYYEDTDAGGVVYHANYLNYFERARTEMLRTKGMELDKLHNEHGILFVVRSAQLDYLKSARFNELLAVKSEITETKKASFTFLQTLNRQEEILCCGEIRIACLDASNMRPKLIPSSLLEQLSK